MQSELSLEVSGICPVSPLPPQERFLVICTSGSPKRLVAEVVPFNDILSAIVVK